jgi:hypothetical protein
MPIFFELPVWQVGHGGEGVYGHGDRETGSQGASGPEPMLTDSPTAGIVQLYGVW